jgi:translation initiation factor IF-2
LRVHELAKELGVASRELLEALRAMGVDGVTASSSVPDQMVPRLRASGGKAVPEAKIKEAIEAPTPKPSRRPRAVPQPAEPEPAAAEAPAAAPVEEPAAPSVVEAAPARPSGDGAVRAPSAPPIRHAIALRRGDLARRRRPRLRA